MKLGAEPKKVGMLAGLTVVGAYLFYTNVLSDHPTPTTPAGGPAPTAAPPAAVTTPATQPRRPNARTSGSNFKPSMKRRPEDRIDPTRIDPTLRLDLLAKVQAVGLEGGARNLFQFAAAPPPPTPPRPPEEKILPKTPAQIAAEAQQATTPAAPPPPPPINLKYYGFSTQPREGKKRAFFLDGEEILVAEEGQILKRRYKLVRIGVNSVTMEDVDLHQQQTVPLQEEPAG